MEKYQENFIHFCVQNNILQFGHFTLKSGRQSPYFFNIGLFNTGHKLNFLGQTYQKALEKSQIDFNMIFGPAYKGIPIACAVASAFAHCGHDLPWCFDRKEAKHHGEQGILVGSSPQNKRIAIVDDVITAGTAVGHTIPILKNAGGQPCLLCIALNRQEQSVQHENISAIEEVEKKWNIPVIQIISLSQILMFIEETKTLRHHLEPVLSYRNQYGEKNVRQP